jgi:hypothetical protein
MIQENYEPRRVKELKIKPEILCSIWIMNHEGILRDRFKIYERSCKLVSYYINGRLITTGPDMTFEEYGVFMYDNAAFSIEHNSN